MRRLSPRRLCLHLPLLLSLLPLLLPLPLPLRPLLTSGPLLAPHPRHPLR